MLFQESEKKQLEFAKQSVDAKNAYTKELAKFGIRGERLKRELVDLAADLPAKFAALGDEASALNAPIAYYDTFRNFNGGHTSNADQPKTITLLRLLARRHTDIRFDAVRH